MPGRARGGGGQAQVEPATLLPREWPTGPLSILCVLPLLELCRDNSTSIFRAGRAYMPGSRALSHAVTITVNCTVCEGPQQGTLLFCSVWTPQLTSDTGQSGSGVQTSKDRFREERGQEKARKKMKGTRIY